MKKNVIEKEVKIDGEKWNNCLDKTFKKINKDTKIDGFRKGKAPKEAFIKKFGIERLYPDAVDIAVQSAFDEVLKETKVTLACEPKIDVKTINDKEVVFNFTLITPPEVVLGDYKNLGVKREKAKITKEEIDKAIEDLRLKYAEITVKEKGKVELNDTAIIDFKGVVDGKELDGATGENYPLEIGSNTFIPGFEDGLIGMKQGEEKELKLKFPDNYTPELKNKDVTFTVKLNEIKTRVLPELNSDFYLDLGYEDVKTKEDLEAKIKENLTSSKEASLEDKYIEDVLAKASSNMKVDINKEIIDEEIHRMIHQFEDQLKMQGLNLEQYFEFTGTNHEALHKQMEPEATKRVKYRYLLENVSEAEKISVTDKEAKEKAKEMATNYGISEDELIKAYGSLDVIKYDIKMHKAIDIIKN